MPPQSAKSYMSQRKEEALQMSDRYQPRVDQFNESDGEDHMVYSNHYQQQQPRQNFNEIPIKRRTPEKARQSQTLNIDELEIPAAKVKA